MGTGQLDGWKATEYQVLSGDSAGVFLKDFRKQSIPQSLKPLS
jgi:hypothetical protein